MPTKGGILVYRPRHLDSSKVKHSRFQSIFFILLVLLVVFILLESSFFEVKKITVIGNSQLTEQEIIQLSCFSKGDNIFKIDTEDAIKNIELAPLVKGVRIKRKLPSTIEINIDERRAAGLLATGGGFLVVDDEGIYLRVGKIGSAEVPVITGLEIEIPELGQPVKADGIGLALGIIGDIEPGYLSMISEIHMAAKQEFYIYNVEGIQGYLGEPVDIGGKLQYFFSIIEQFKISPSGGEIEYIDLSSKGWPVVQMKEVP